MRLVKGRKIGTSPLDLGSGCWRALVWCTDLMSLVGTASARFSVCSPDDDPFVSLSNFHCLSSITFSVV